MNKVIIGTQWGDEGKGKIVDFLARDADVVVRFQGGDNAGHTVVLEDKTYKLHLIPSGILYPDKICVLGNGMVIDPANLLLEMSNLQKTGCSVRNLYVSERAHVIMPYHKQWDTLEEKMKGENKIGTTMRGIGPCYTDKIARIGIRMSDLLEPSVLEKRLCQILPLKEKIWAAFGEKLPVTINDLLTTYTDYGNQLRPHITDTTMLLYHSILENKNILLEGAQGTFLGIDHGTYPFVTGSETTSGNACCGSGMPLTKIHKVVGVVKAYCSRVGSGPFPSELLDELGQKIREQGHEYGTTTGRARRCGWLDLVMVKYAIILNGIGELALTKLDVLTGINPLQICVGYRYQGQRIDTYPASLEVLQKLEPVYEELPGWQENIANIRKFEELPVNCQKYVQKIEEFLNVPARIIAVGAERNQTIIRNPEVDPRVPSLTCY